METKEKANTSIKPTNKMKYAEVTIIKNIETSTLYNSIQRFFGVDGERIVDAEKDVILMEFEGEPPFDTKEKYVDLKYEFCKSVADSRIELITTDKKYPSITSYVSLDPNIDENGTKRLNLNKICKENPKYTYNTIIPSVYNYIFYCYLNTNIYNVLYLARITSAEKMPRFVIAYDDRFISKLQVIYIIRYILLTEH